MEAGVGVPLGLRLRQGSPGCPRGPGGDSLEPSGTDTGDIFGRDVPYYFLCPTKRHQAGEVSALESIVHSRAVALLSLALLSSKSSDCQLREDPGPSGLKPAPHPLPRLPLPGPPRLRSPPAPTRLSQATTPALAEAAL